MAAISIFVGGDVSAELEKWTNRNGKTVELDLVAVTGKGTDALVEFRTKSGKTVKFKLADLQDMDQARALETARTMAAQTVLTARELCVEDYISGRGVSFELVVGGADHFRIISYKVDPVKIGGREIKASDWTQGAGADSKGNQWITLSCKKDFEELDITGLQIRGRMVLQILSESKEAEGMVKLPRKRGDKRGAKLGPYQVNLEWDSSDSIGATFDAGKKGFLVDDYGFLLEGKRGRGSERAELFLDETAKLIITYHEVIREVEVPFSATAPPK